MKAPCLLFFSAVLSLSTAGCGPSAQEKAYEHAVEGLSDRISGIQKLEPDATNPGMRVQKEFVVPSDQVVLDVLRSVGPSALDSPIVLWGLIRPLDEKDLTPDYLLHLELVPIA